MTSGRSTTGANYHITFLDDGEEYLADIVFFGMQDGNLLFVRSETVTHEPVSDLPPVAPGTVRLSDHWQSEGAESVEVLSLSIEEVRSISTDWRRCGRRGACRRLRPDSDAVRGVGAPHHHAPIRVRCVPRCRVADLQRLQANLSDPIAHEPAGAKAREAMLFHANVIAGNLALTARVFEGYNDSGVPGEGTCTMPEVPAQAPRVQVGGAGAAPCQPGSLESRLAYEIDVVLLKVKASCEKLTVEAGVGIPGLMAFAKVEKGWDTNGATAFVGVKGEIPRVGSSTARSSSNPPATAPSPTSASRWAPRSKPSRSRGQAVWQDKIRMGLCPSRRR